MVLPAVLRNPAVDPGQVARRDRTVRRDCRAHLPALARHLARKVGAVPAAVRKTLLGVCDHLYRTGLARYQDAGRHLSDLVATADVLLLRLLPADTAGARIS